MHWTLITEPQPQSGPINMGSDAALLRAAQEGGAFLRLYRWDPPCLSFGRHEPARRRYDREAILRRGLATVRRITGGRAVWHDRELTYAVAAPEDTFGSLEITYHAIHHMLAGALRRLGIDAAVAPRSRRAAPVDAGACFAAPVGGEVVVGHRKLVGSAQCREGNAFLQHGSILLENTQDLISDLTLGPPPPLHATSLADVSARSIDWAELAAAIETEARAQWSGSWHTQSRSTVPDAHDIFVQSSWTWRR